MSARCAPHGVLAADRLLSAGHLLRPLVLLGDGADPGVDGAELVAREGVRGRDRLVLLHGEPRDAARDDRCRYTREIDRGDAERFREGEHDAKGLGDDEGNVPELRTTAVVGSLALIPVL